LRGPFGHLEAIVEQKDATDDQLRITEINSGIYAFDAEALIAGLRRLAPHNAQGELYLTDVIGIARTDGHQVGAMTCADEWLVRGVNDRVQLSELGAECNRRIV